MANYTIHSLYTQPKVASCLCSLLGNACRFEVIILGEQKGNQPLPATSIYVFCTSALSKQFYGTITGQ